MNKEQSEFLNGFYLLSPADQAFLRALIEDYNAGLVQGVFFIPILHIFQEGGNYA